MCWQAGSRLADIYTFRKVNLGHGRHKGYTGKQEEETGTDMWGIYRAKRERTGMSKKGSDKSLYFPPIGFRMFFSLFV